MGAGTILLLVIMILLGFYLLYGRWITFAMGVDEHRRTPVTHRSGRRRHGIGLWPLLTSQAVSIIGLSPLTTTLASLLFGFVPALLWLIVSGLWWGVSAQLSILLATVRSGGRGIDEVMHKYLRAKGRLPLVAMSFFLLLLMFAMLLDVTSSSLTGTKLTVQPKDYLPDKEAFRVQWEADPSTDMMDYVATEQYEEAMARAEDIARSQHHTGPSLLIVLAGAALLALLWRVQEKLGLLWMILCAGLCGVGIYYFHDYPLPYHLMSPLWESILAGYILLCALTDSKTLSVPRDMLVGLLTGGVFVMAAAGLVVGNPELSLPPFTGWIISTGLEGSERQHMLLPSLCAMLSCGSLMGIHSLFQSQGVAQRIENERHAKPVVLGAMCFAVLVGSILLLTGSAVWSSSAPAVGSQSFEQWTMGGLASSIVRLGIPQDTVYLLLTLCFALLAVCGMDAVVRTARGLMQRTFGEYRGHALGRFLSSRPTMAVLTCGAGLLLMRAGYRSLWTLVAPASLVLAACALWIGASWLRAGHRASGLATLPAVLVSLLSVWMIGDNIYAQVMRYLAGEKLAIGAYIQAGLMVLMVFLLLYILVVSRRTPRAGQEGA